jgi:hypothetical protein
MLLIQVMDLTALLAYESLPAYVLSTDVWMFAYVQTI